MEHLNGYISSGYWKRSSDLPIPLSGSRGGVLRNNTVVLGGGVNSSGDAIDKLYEYDPITETFKVSTLSFPYTIKNHSSFSSDGKVVFVGGYQGIAPYSSRSYIVNVSNDGVNHFSVGAE